MQEQAAWTQFSINIVLRQWNILLMRPGNLHSKLVQRQTLLSHPPTRKPFYEIHNPKGVASLIQLRISLSKLNFHKFNDKLRDTIAALWCCMVINDLSWPKFWELLLIPFTHQSILCSIRDANLGKFRLPSHPSLKACVDKSINRLTDELMLLTTIVLYIITHVNFYFRLSSVAVLFSEIQAVTFTRHDSKNSHWSYCFVFVKGHQGSHTCNVPDGIVLVYLLCQISHF